MTSDDLPGPGSGQTSPAQWRNGELLAAYRRVVATVDGPPGYVLAAARAAFLARDLDGAVAVLIADSRAAEGETVYEPIRAEPDLAQGRWQLSFKGGGVHVDIEIGEEQGRLRLLGLFSGTSGDDFYLESAGQWRRIDVNGLGRFMVDDLTHGPIRLRCRSSDGTRVTTAWVTI